VSDGDDFQSLGIDLIMKDENLVDSVLKTAMDLALPKTSIHLIHVQLAVAGLRL
jgi:hypothetical protein